jgi:lipopolysaccharide/colanic/teichoic acid biosynthesis glycosyltransferase
MRRRFLIQMAASDAATLAIACSLAGAVVFGQPRFWIAGPTTGALNPLLLALVVGAFVGRVAASYWVGLAPRPSYGRGLLVVTAGMLGAMTGIVFVREIYWSRSFLLYVSVLWLALATLYRMYKARRPWEERLLIVSTDEVLIEDLRASPNVGEVSVVSPLNSGQLAAPEPDQVVVVDFKEAMGDRMAQFVSSAVLAGRRVRALSSVYEEHLGRIPVVHLAEGWELAAPFQRVRPWLGGKRAFDVVTVLVTAVVWLPLLVVGMLVVRVASKGPVFFHQERVGLNGATFTIVKLRSMVVGADDHGPRFASHGDERIYRGGQFLRKYRLDEIPQLWNVLRGELSLVGPRPEQVPFVEEFSKRIPFYDQRHVVRPGATGWAQVNTGYAHGESETFEKLTYDLFYIKHMSPLMDLQVILRSFRIVLRGIGAR